jgi:RimJ/RimL family protein N-acetyltransferase
LRIRPFVADDWRSLHAYMSDPDVTAYLPGGLNEKQAKEFVAANAIGGREPFDAYALVLAADNALIGHVYFHPWFGLRTYEIGWVVRTDQQARGYATEAARALLDHAFESLGLHRVIASCHAENAASRRVMEKLGMRREAHFRKCGLGGDGEWFDEYLYAVLAEEWPVD